MNIIAIDPGPKESGIVYMLNGQPHSVDILENEYLGDALGGMESWPLCEHLAIEKPQSRGNIIPQTVLDTCVWIGRFEQAASIPFTEIFPATIRTWLCGKPAVTKAAVKQALKDRYGEVGTKKNPGPLYGFAGTDDHKWAALAVGTAWYMMQECEHG